ncbi:MAG: hypothetical protein JRI34_04870 [Deltaproteobacteria bacterium]|nr:hypothetical protein [Deltaproteobacteria bacterium]
MDFSQYITTPKNTAAIDPLITTIKLTRGRLISGWLYFPTGPAGLLHFVARVGVHQIIPFNAGQSFHLDDCVVPISIGIDLLEPPYIVECHTWNLSTTYDHALTVCFALNPLVKKKYDLDQMTKAFSGTEGYQKS